ncbi:MAG: oligosaccharide flippase family protein, partial [Oscillospiraceae bacterium]
MDKYKKLAANTIIFAIGSFGSKILSFLLINLYTTHMSPDDYGNADLIIKLGNFLIPIFSLSIADAILRYGIDKDYSNSQVFTTGITTILFGSTILALLSPIFNLIPFLDGNGFLLYIFIYASGFRAVCSQFVRGKGQVKLFAFDGIFATLTMFIFNLIFLVGLDMGMKGYVLSLILSDISSTIFLMFAANLPKYLNPRALNKDIAKTMIRYSLPLIPTALLWNITSLTDGLFVKYGVGDAANGVYTAAYKIPNLIAMVSTMFIQAWNMSAISEHKEKGIEHFYTKVFSSYQSMMYLAGGALLLIIKPLTNLLVGGEKFAGCYKFTPLLVLAVLMTCFSQFMSSVYSATQHTKNSF